MDKCRNRKFVYIIGHQLSMIADMRSHLGLQHLHSCTDTVLNQLLHVEKKTLIYCPVHHHCGLYLPWNFEKQMVPCRTVMQLARKLRTDSPGTGKLNQICTACNGHKICVYSNRAIYIGPSTWSEPWTKICYYHSTVNSFTISRAYISNFKPTMPEDPRPRPGLKGGRQVTLG